MPSFWSKAPTDQQGGNTILIWQVEAAVAPAQIENFIREINPQSPMTFSVAWRVSGGSGYTLRLT